MPRNKPNAITANNSAIKAALFTGDIFFKADLASDDINCILPYNFIIYIFGSSMGDYTYCS